MTELLLLAALKLPPVTPDKRVVDPTFEICYIDTTQVEREQCIKKMYRLMRQGQ